MGILGEINQIGIVTPDIEQSIEEFKKIGLDGWSDVFVNMPDKFEDMVADGELREYASKCASNYDLNVEIELIEPLDDNCDYAAFLKRNGGQPGIHHLRVDFDDIDDVHSTGKELLLHGVDVVHLEKAGEVDGFEYSGIVLSNRDGTGETIRGIPVVAGLENARKCARIYRIAGMTPDDLHPMVRNFVTFDE